MKKITFSYCDDCPYLKVSSGKFTEGEDDKLEIYNCNYTNSIVKGYHEGERYVISMKNEIARSDQMMAFNDPITIPDWCPLEDA